MRTRIDRLIDAATARLAAGLAGWWLQLGPRLAIHARSLTQARWRGLVVVVPLLLAIAAPPLLAERLVVGYWYDDLALPLDMSLRWHFGHLPHTDFSIPIGISYWLIEGLASELVGLDPRSVVVANVIAALAIAVAGTALVMRRLSGALAGMLLLGVLVMALSPRVLGDLPGQVSHLAAYNKWGLAIIGILYVALFVEPRRRSARATALDAVAIAFLIVWLIYLKLTFAVIMIAGAAVALHYAPANRRAILAALALAAAVVAAISVAGDLNAVYLADIAQAAAASDLMRSDKLLDDARSSPATLLVFALCLAVYGRDSGAPPARIAANIILALGLFVASRLALNQVHDTALPLVFAVLLVLAQRGLGEPARGRRAAPHVAPVLGAAALVLVATVGEAQTAFAYWWQDRHDVGVRFCDDESRPGCRILVNLNGFVPDPGLRPLPAPELGAPATGPASEWTIPELFTLCDTDSFCLYWRVRQQLLSLLTTELAAGDRPLVLGFSNVAPYYFGLEPPRGVLAWMDINRTLSAAAHPEAATLFADVSLLAVPRVDLWAARIPGLEGFCGEHIARDFGKVAETQAWALWRRRAAEEGE